MFIPLHVIVTVFLTFAGDANTVLAEVVQGGKGDTPRDSKNNTERKQQHAEQYSPPHHDEEDVGIKLQRFERNRSKRYDHRRRLSDVDDGIFTNTSTSIFNEDVGSNSTLFSSKNSVLDVVIVGAGWAGAAAAITLQKQGITNFKVLEAREEIGGRSRTIMEPWQGENIPIDLGSQWIHGMTGNPVLNVAKSNGIPYGTSEGLGLYYKDNNGGAYSNSGILALESELYSDGFFPYQEERQESTDNDQPLRATANQYIANNGLTPAKRNLLEMFLSNNIGQDFGASLEDLSLWWWDSGNALGGNDAFLHQGYSELFNAYTQSIQSKIETSAKVTVINTKSKNPSTVKYIDETGSEIELKALKVLVTVPLGVLKAQSITFQPKLPKKKRTAISQLGMGLLNKVVLFWEDIDVFWPLNTEWFAEAAQRESSFEFYNPRSLNGGQPILVGFVYGRDAEYLEEEYGSDQELYKSKMTEAALLALRNMFGGTIPDPKHAIVTKWGSDEFAYGSYSFNKVGMSRKAHILLSKTIRKKKLYFAGEACHSRYFGTTHGK